MSAPSQLVCTAISLFPMELDSLAPRIWLEPSTYFVLCLPAFSPELCGREAEEGATVAKDSASMERLEKLHAKA
jgi:hypothetical protein